MGISREEVWYGVVKDNLWGGKKKRIKIYKKADEALTEFDKRFLPVSSIVDSEKKETYIITYHNDQEVLMLGKESEEWLKVRAGLLKIGFIIKEKEGVIPCEIRNIIENPDSVTLHIMEAI